MRQGVAGVRLFDRAMGIRFAVSPSRVPPEFGNNVNGDRNLKWRRNFGISILDKAPCRKSDASPLMLKKTIYNSEIVISCNFGQFPDTKWLCDYGDYGDTLINP